MALDFDKWLEVNRTFVEIVKGRISGDGTLYERMQLNGIDADLERRVSMAATELNKRGVGYEQVERELYRNYLEADD